QAVGLDAAEEAAGVALVTRRPADLMHFQKDGVRVAIDVNLAHLLEVAALLTLAPELVATAAEVDGPPCAKRLLVGFAVHPRQHEDRACLRIRSDGGAQAAGLVEVDHGSSLLSRSVTQPKASFTSGRLSVTNDQMPNGNPKMQQILQGIMAMMLAAIAEPWL